MKTPKVIYAISSFLIIFSFISCSSDDNKTDKVEPTVSELTLDKEEVSLVVGDEPTIIKIISGNGDYNAFALNPDLVTIHLDNDELSLEALKLGTTEIYVSDKEMLVKKLPVSILTSNTIVIDEGIDKAEFTSVKGSSETFTLKITSGNGGYKVESSNPDLFTAKVKKDSIIEITTTKGNSGGEGILKITDSAGIEKNITIVIESIEDPITDQFVQEVVNKTITSSEVYFLNTLADDYNFYIEEYDDLISVSIRKEVDIDGWFSHESSISIRYPISLGLNNPTDQATIDYENFPEQYNNSPDRFGLEYLEIVKDDKESLRVVFKYTDEDDIIRYGYFIHKK